MKTKELIFDKAAFLFYRNGYAATSVRDIAQAVGLEPSSLYSHMKSKSELLSTICMSCADQFDTGIKEIQSQKLDPRSFVEAIIDLNIHIATNNTTAITVFSSDWRHLEGESRKTFIEKRSYYEQSIIAELKKGAKDGVFQKANPEFLLNSIISSMTWVFRWYRSAKKDQVPEVTSVVKSLVFKGLEV